MTIEAKALSVTPPVQGKNLWVLDTSTTSETMDIPGEWARAFITIQADGADVYLAFSANKDAVVDPQSTEDTCIKIPDGQHRSFDMAQLPWTADDAKKIFISLISSASGGFIRFHRSSGPVSL